jgi:hypothetical protein
VRYTNDKERTVTLRLSPSSIDDAIGVATALQAADIEGVEIWRSGTRQWPTVKEAAQ